LWLVIVRFGARPASWIGNGPQLQTELVYAVDHLNAADDRLRREGVEIVAGGPDERWFGSRPRRD